MKEIIATSIQLPKFFAGFILMGFVSANLQKLFQPRKILSNKYGKGDKI